MKNPYDFERHTPPILSEKMLRKKAKKRKYQRYILWIVIAAVLIQIGALLIGLQLAQSFPKMAFVWFVQTSVSGFIGVAAVLIYVYKRKEVRI